MILNDEWTEGLTPKQQNIVMDYVINLGDVQAMDFHGYAGKNIIKKFLNSEKGRKAVRRYTEHKFDEKKDFVKMQLVKMYFARAFFHPGDIITPDGAFIDIDGEKITSLKQLGKYAYCIEGIETEIVGIDKKTGKEIKKVKIKLCNRDKALEKIGELFKIGIDDDEDNDEKSIFEMSDEEREAEIKKLLQQDHKLIEFIKGGENG